MYKCALNIIILFWTILQCKSYSISDVNKIEIVVISSKNNTYNFDGSIVSFKPVKSTSPITPKQHLSKRDSSESGKLEDGPPCVDEGFRMPVRMHSDVVPELTLTKLY